jgi:hypothetical protein
LPIFSTERISSTESKRFLQQKISFNVLCRVILRYCSFERNKIELKEPQYISLLGLIFLNKMLGARIKKISSRKLKLFGVKVLLQSLFETRIDRQFEN